MEEMWRLADEFGPARIIHVQAPALGLKAVLVVDNVACGPAIGGLRMAPDVSTGECVRLARAMTLKNAAAGLAHGGAKSVLVGDPRMPRPAKQALVRALAHALRHEHDYLFGPDMGTDETCMGWVHDEIGRAVGRPAVLGGIPLDALGATGWGLAHAAEVAAPACGVALNGARVAIQGFGVVGRHAARFLAQRGALLVAASDSTGALAARGVLVIPDFIANAGGVICAAMEHAGASRGAAFETIAQKIRANTEAVLAAVRRDASLPRAAALAIATARVSEAMAYRRFGLF